jgi:hypothetical protein
MPSTPEGEKMAGKGGKPAQPIPPVQSNLQKKLLLLTGMIVLGLPVFLVLLGPPLVGAWILWHQFALYENDARWRPFSVFQWVTDTVDQDLAENLGWPGLASCNQFRSPAVSDSDGGVFDIEQIQRECPELGPWQAWLLSPNALFGLRGYLVPVLRFIPISSLLFLLGLIAAYLLRFFGWRWRTRAGPPPPKLLGSAGVSGRISSGTVELKK